MENKITAAIITIGDELLIGHTIDTNSAFISKQLQEIGINTVFKASVADNNSSIVEGLEICEKLSDLIVITGGLGPTKDDITKTTLTQYFKTHLEFNTEAYTYIASFLEKMGGTMNELNKKQADLPVGATFIPNRNGTASGMWFKKDNKSIIALPGVPHELEQMVQLDVIPMLKEYYKCSSIIHKYVITAGIAEALLAEKLSAWENALPQTIGLAYLPSPGMVKLRLTYQEDLIGKNQIDAIIKNLTSIIPTNIVSYQDCTLGEIVGKILAERGEWLSIAESCTGGYLSHLITVIPGSSCYFKGSIIAYSNQVKTNLLSVSPDILNEYGAVSKHTVYRMAEKIRNEFGTDYSIAISGIAGPGGATPDKPVGTVWIAVSSKSKTIAEVFTFGNDRTRVIQRASNKALYMLWMLLMNHI
ncbi:MAG: competence/damage-inducible protein A [Bacteroidales bacterium]